jgi:transcriptional regulator with PAS, ATPase and Fis domain
LIESELFGYESGAFSGAMASGKKGLIEEAAEGTLFLDGVNDLSMEAQAKLLRFLEYGEYYKVGGTKKLRVHTRLLSTTNTDLLNLVEKGLFRLDLYYRLAVVKIEIPSLNERSEDIIPIAKFFLEEFSEKKNKTFIGFSPQTEEYLLHHQWMGNIRELRNLIERGVLVGDGPVLNLGDLGVEKEHEGKQIQNPPAAEGMMFHPIPNEGIDLNALEKHFIEQAYKKAEGNDAKAAKLLKMNYYSFRYRRKKLSIPSY